MAGVNKVILIGNLGADPELRETSSGNKVCNFRIATSEQWANRDGEKQEHTEWHRIVVWGRQAETCAQYLAKGRQVYVEGRLQTRKWQDRDGRDRWTTEVVAEQVVFLSVGGTAGDRQQSLPSGSGRHREEPWGGSPGDDPIPF